MLQIEEQKLEIKAESKIGSLGNVKYRPGGGDKKIFDDKEYLRQMSTTSSQHDAGSARSSRAPSEGRASGAHVSFFHKLLPTACSQVLSTTIKGPVILLAWEIFNGPQWTPTWRLSRAPSFGCGR